METPELLDQLRLSCTCDIAEEGGGEDGIFTEENKDAGQDGTCDEQAEEVNKGVKEAVEDK